MTKRILLSVVLVVLLMISQMPQAWAAGSKPLVSVAPFLQTVQIAPSDGLKNFDIKVTNDSKSTLAFHLSVVDFGSLDETGGLVFAGSNASSLTKKYGLASWLRLSTNDLSLAPNQTAKVTATIINDTKLQPGGHYGAIITSVKNPGASGSNRINVNQELSSLVLATKTGGEKYDLHLDSLRYSGSWWQLPRAVTLRFYNPGNVHVVPRGLVKLIAPNGQVVSQGVINEASSFVLPETHRQIPVELQNVGRAGWQPGLYHIRVDYRYDGLGRFASKTFAAHFLNLSSLLLIVVVLVAAIWLAMKLRRWKEQKPPPAKKKPVATKTATKKPIKVVVEDGDK